MTGKKLNIIILVTVILFAIIWGCYGVYRYNLMKDLDNKHEQQTESEREDEKGKNQSEITTNNNNDNNNNANPTTPNSGQNGENGTIVDITKFNFVEMFEYAEKKLNKSTNVWSEGMGTAYLSGPTSMPNIKLNKDKVNISFVRAQNSRQKFFNFKIAGPLLDGLFDLNYESSAYSEGGIYYYYFNQDNVGWHPMSQNLIKEKLDFEFNQTFIDVNLNSIKPNTASALIYDKYSQQYSGSVELNPELSSTRYAKTLKGVLDANETANILSSKITVTFDKFGNFASITYEDTFKVDVKHGATGVTMYATINSNYTEVFKVAGGNKNVIITKPDAIK